MTLLSVLYVAIGPIETAQNCQKKKLIKLSYKDQYWYCAGCTNIFPYHDVNEDEFQFLHLNDDMNESKFEIYKKCCDIEFECFKFNEYNISDKQSSADPVNHFYNGINSECSYFTDDNFTTKFKNINGFSVIHFNCRSVKSCFEDLKQYLLDIKKTFDIICISESWLTNKDDLFEYNIDSYNVVAANRSNKRGGGVMLYVSNLFDFSVVEQMADSVDDLYECISIEIKVKNGKNIIVSCLYRAPASNIELFNENIEKLLQRVKRNKIYYLVGDFNINLINSETHSWTRNFIDLLFSYGLYPRIKKPTRICLGSATLIDNIFTNCLLPTKNGILINDISDHLPVFSITEIQNCNRTLPKPNLYKRKIDSESLQQLNNQLSMQDWSSILESSDVDFAYDNFINIIQNHF